MMQQPTGAVPPPMPPVTIDLQQQQQPPPLQQYGQPPPQQQQPWMMMAPPPVPQSQPQAGAFQAPLPQMWPPQPPQVAVAPSQQYGAVAGPVTNADEIRSLWIGDLQYWMDESYIWNCFNAAGEVMSVKVIRNKQTGQPEGYGFLEFVSRAAAERVLLTYNGTLMPSTTEQNFRLNWATLGAGQKRQDDTPDYTIFVGDLAADVTDYVLQETFRAHYQSVRSAKVITDHTTGRSKGYGFVKFGDEAEQQRAMTEMNGMFCSTRPMRIGPAANKKTTTVQQKASYQSNQANPGESDPNNTTIFVGGLDPTVTDEQLKQIFGQFGDLVHVKIPVGKGCGFVQFANRASAEQALSILNGTQIGAQNVRLSWGRSPAAKQTQQSQAQWNGGYYGYPQGYEAYGYAAAPQDPNMYYAAGYTGYGNYQQAQQ